MKRARGRAYKCVCGQEKLRLTRAGVEARVDKWGYLFGLCGGGVKLRFDGVKVVEVREVGAEEAKRVRSMPVRKVDALEAMLVELDDRARARLDAIVAEIRDAIQQGMVKWVAVGQLLAEAKKLLKKGDFGLWVERNGMDRHNAHRLISVFEMVKAVPGFSSTFRKIGQEKTVLLTRLPDAKRLEVLEHGIPIDGKPVNITDATFRQLNTYVRSIVGKDPRGRKKKADEATKATERFGLPTETFEAFQSVLKGMQTLTRKAKDGWTDRERPAVRKLWSNVNHLFYKLQEDHGMGLLLDGGR